MSGIGREQRAGGGARHSQHGFTVLRSATTCDHGEKVAFGTLAQLVLPEQPDGAD